MLTLSFAWRNLWRNKLRSFVTLFGVTTLLVLVTLLMGIVGSLQQAREVDPMARRLVTRHEVSLTLNLPEAYWNRIRAIPHVREVNPQNWFGGVYEDPKNFFAQFFTDPETLLTVYGKEDIDLPPEQAADWKKDRQGAIASRKIAEKYGWDLGERIVLKGDIYPVDVELNLSGIYDGKADALYFHRDYVEEAMGRPGSIGFFGIEVDSPENLPAVSAAVDALFQNSDAPTKTETEAAFAAGFISMMGNVEGLVKRLVLIITVTMLLTAGNTMAMAVRERTTEIAILKAIGFRPGRILGFIVTEAMILSTAAGLIGVGGIWLLTILLFRVLELTFPFLWYPPIVQWETGVALLAGSVLLGAVAASIPAWLAARRHVIDGLRRN